MARHARWFRRGWLLLILILLLAPAPGHAQPAEIRIVTLRAAPDENYRGQPNWEAALRRMVKTVSDIYEKNFQIRLVLKDIVPWTVGPGAGAQRMLTRLRAEVPVGTADILVAFVTGRCDQPPYGVAEAFDRFAVVLRRCLEPEPAQARFETTLAHEIGHLFGAFHPAEGVTSVMWVGSADRFDDQATRVIRLTRSLDFARGVQSLDAEARRAWSAIYAEGHARGDANLLASALSRAAGRAVASGNTDEAEGLTRDAIATDPRAAYPHLVMSRVLSAKGRLDEALGELQVALGLDVRLVEARIDRGYLLLRLRRDDAALDEFRSTLRADPRAVRAYLGIATILAERNRFPEAISALQSATQVAPTYGPAYLQLAIELDRIGQYADSRVAAEQARTLGQTVPPALLETRSYSALLAPPLPACPDRSASSEAEPVRSLEEEAAPFGGYFNAVRQRIKAHWIYPRSAGQRNVEGELALEFQINKAGGLDCAVVRRSSGTPILDQAAMDAVRLGAPYPPVPDQVARRTLTINGEFRYQIQTAPTTAPNPVAPKPSAPAP